MGEKIKTKFNFYRLGHICFVLVRADQHAVRGA